jgi:hypothetical protein
MNRLAPLVHRPPEPVRAWAGRAPSPRYGIAAARRAKTPSAWSDDVKLFATAWLGGLVFFGTLIA